MGDDTDKRIRSLRKAMALSRGQGTQSLGTWFLGPKGESRELLQSLIAEAIHHSVDGRESTFPEDPPWADPTTGSYKSESALIQNHYRQLVRNLERYSVPFSSYRYQGHMLWDQTLPSVAGYIAALLYNQNNVAAEASPLTTALEIEVAKDLCKMVGYEGKKGSHPWGHITCDGSIANIEALWAGRNTKLYAFAASAALQREDQLQALDYIEVVPTGSHVSKRLIDLDWWELFNLTADVILDIPIRMRCEAKKNNIDGSSLNLIQKYTVQELGMLKFGNTMDEVVARNGSFTKALANLKVIGPASAHYSLPKATTLLGLGTCAYVKINVRRNARMNIELLKKSLDHHFQKRMPVQCVVAVMGTTEESAVDNLTEILKIRKEFRKKGMDFLIHADGAWGGYFASILNEPVKETPAHNHLTKNRQEIPGPEENADSNRFEAGVALRQLQSKVEDDPRTHEKFIFTNRTGLNAHTETQLRRLKDADTITIDPHKSGFTLYPAGSLLYRDHRMPEMIQITAPVVYHNGDAPTVGVFGVEGSKPGAAAAGVYFSHRIIRTDQSGYGRILGRCTFNAKRVFSQLLAIDSPDFRISALTDLSAQELDVVKEWSALSNIELWQRLHDRPHEFDIFRRTGPDLNIISYALNPIIDGVLNQDPKKTNEFNNALFKKLSSQSIDEPIPEIIVTSSSFDPEYSAEPIKHLREQLGVDHDDALEMNFLLTTVMNPWLSDADNGRRNMIPEVVGYLQEEAEALIHELYYTAESHY